MKQTICAALYLGINDGHVDLGCNIWDGQTVFVNTSAWPPTKIQVEPVRVHFALHRVRPVEHSDLDRTRIKARDYGEGGVSLVPPSPELERATGLIYTK